MRYISILLLFLFVSFTGAAQDGFKSTAKDVTLEPTDLVGVWGYQVTGIDEGYEQGLLIIDKTEGPYAVQVQLQNKGSLSAFDVQVEHNELQFHVNLDGVERVTVVLWIKGKEFEGQVITKGSRYAVKGERQLPKN